MQCYNNILLSYNILSYPHISFTPSTRFWRFRLRKLSLHTSSPRVCRSVDTVASLQSLRSVGWSAGLRLCYAQDSAPLTNLLPSHVQVGVGRYVQSCLRSSDTPSLHSLPTRGASPPSLRSPPFSVSPPSVERKGEIGSRASVGTSSDPALPSPPFRTIPPLYEPTARSRSSTSLYGSHRRATPSQCYALIHPSLRSQSPFRKCYAFLQVALEQSFSRSSFVGSPSLLNTFQAATSCLSGLRPSGMHENLDFQVTRVFGCF